MKTAKTIHLLALALALGAAVPFAATAETCITDVMVVGGKNKSVTNSYAELGWKVIKQDLNAGAGGDYVFLLYKSADSAIVSNGFITGFYIKTGKDGVTNELMQAGRVYSLAPCAGSEAFVEGQGDLNSKTVKQGDVIHLYYTKSVFPDNRAVTGITFNGTQDGAIGKNGGMTGYDLNSHADGDFIYMHVSTTALPYAPGVSYLDPTDPENPEKVCHGYTFVTDQTTLTSGWYVVAGAVTNGSRIYVSGDVNLILTDGAELAANRGIVVDRNDSVTNSLTIWAQSTDAVAGKLTARGGDNQAGIGGIGYCPGGVVTVNGGTVTARGGAGGAGIGGGWEGAGGAVTVNGGMVTAKGDWNGAGIGGGSQGAGGTVTVNGGKVTANGGTNAAGIGGGNYGGGGAVTVNGGMVEANGGVNAAGIGGGERGGGGAVTVNGGSVEAHGGWDGAGIGGGHQGVGGEVTVNGGTVEAHGGVNGAGIGGGYCGWWGGTVTVNGGTVTAHGGDASAGIGGGDAASGGTVTVNGGTVEAKGGGGAAIGGGDGGGDGLLSITGMKVGYVESDGEVHEWAAPGNRDGYCRNREEKTVRIEVCLPHVFEGGICKICGEKALYLDPTDPVHPEKLCTDFTVITDQTTLTSGWYVVAGAITIDSRITVSGDVNLILMDRAELAANEGITVEEGNSLTIWAQSTDAVAGKLTAQGSAWQAGIGGVNWTPCGAVTINGGTVEAHCGADAAGIGGGYQGAGGVVTVNGGSVEAHGGTNGAGIGGGQNGGGGEVTVNGGTVEAHGGQYGAGIGGGWYGGGGVVTVNGGSVEAHGGTNAAGIGGGEWSPGGEVTVNGGTVEAKGGTNAAGIGGGDGGGWNDGSLSIDGMKVGYVEADGKVHEWAECGDRGGYCRNRDMMTVRIEVCDLHVDDDSNAFCDICGKFLPLTLDAGVYFKATLSELGYDVPTDGTAYSVTPLGLPAGLKLKYNAAVTKKVKVKGKWKKVVVKAAKSEWWIEGVPTAAMDYWTNPAYLMIAARGKTVTGSLPVEIKAQEVKELGTFPLGTAWNAESPLYLPGVTNGWTVSGLPSGLKYTPKLVTKANKKGKKVVSVTTNALPYSVYGKVKAAGLFTVTAKKKNGAYYETMKYRMLVTPKAVDTALFGDSLTNITTMAYVPLNWNLESGEAVPSVPSVPFVSSAVGGKVAKVAGLPTGLAFAASTTYKDKKKTQVKQYGQTIVGTPTKPGTYVVTFTKNVKSGKKTVAKTAQILWKVVPNDAEVELGFNTEGGVVEGGMVGFKYGDLLAFEATSNATVMASGLPAGMKLVRLEEGGGRLGEAALPAGSAAYAFTGFTAKAGTYLVTVTATLNGKTVRQRVALKVEGLPAHAKGSFYGKTFTSPINVTGSNFSLNMTNVVGLATMGVTSAGKISGKFQVYGTNWTFSANSYAWMDEWRIKDQAVKRNQAFGTRVTARYAYKERAKVKGKWKMVSRTLTRTLEVNVDGSGVLVHDPVDGVSAYLHQDLWGSTYKKVGQKVFVTGKKKYKVYQSTVDVGGKSCPLTVNVTTAGKATVTLKWNTGKKKNGKWVYYTPSCSTVVYPTGDSPADPENFTGEVNYYFAPNANGFPGVGGEAAVGVGL